MSKFTDDLHLVEIGSPPTSPSQLLRDLGVRKAPKADQQAAVEAWLQEHDPVPVLRLGLEYWASYPEAAMARRTVTRPAPEARSPGRRR